MSRLEPSAVITEIPASWQGLSSVATADPCDYCNALLIAQAERRRPSSIEQHQHSEQNRDRVTPSLIRSCQLVAPDNKLPAPPRRLPGCDRRADLRANYLAGDHELYTPRYSFEITEVLRSASKIPVSFGDAIVWTRS